MFSRSSATHISLIRLSLLVVFLGCLAWFVLLSFSETVRDTGGLRNHTTREAMRQQQLETDPSTTKLEGAAALAYLEKTGDGQDLMRTVIADQYRLKWQDRAPDGEATGGGYLGMSHNQNLNAWFDAEGVTVRPTLDEKDRDKRWQLGFRLKGYGYGKNLEAAAPILAQEVKGNRVEYKRRDCQLPIADCQFKEARTIATMRSRSDALLDFQSAITNRKSSITEWYENRPEGIEQGFTIGARLERSETVAPDAPLRLELGLAGDLRAQMRDEAQGIELVDKGGEIVLIYAKLSAVDADGKMLAARMEASEDGLEITLIIDDRVATYPLVIDPIITPTPEQVLDEHYQEAGGAYGWSVAIDGNYAVIGGPNVDFPSGVDRGMVFLAERMGTSWFVTGQGGAGTGQCGYSVAIKGTKVVYGCPQVQPSFFPGNAYTFDVFNWQGLPGTELLPPQTFFGPGHLYGATVAITDDTIVVGAPLWDGFDGSPDIGAVHNFSLAGTWRIYYPGESANDNFGTSVAITMDTLVIGAPGVDVSNGVTTVPDAGTAYVYIRVVTAQYEVFQQRLVANDPKSGMRYGAGVGISGDTVVVASSADNDRGQLAGAVYVFGRNGTTWTQRQKLTGSDTRAGDRFGFFATAIEGNTIVVGAHFNDNSAADPTDNRGAVYIFTRNIDTWIQQARISPSSLSGGAPGNEFGVGVAINGNKVLIGAIGADLPGKPNAGTAYVYGLDCIPPSNTRAVSCGGQFCTTSVACPGSSLIVSVSGSLSGGTFQWRRNGQVIPGETSQLVSITANTSTAGTYDVIVSNACGSEISRPFVLSLQTFSLNLSSQNFGAAGSNGSVNVSSTASCAWTAVSNSPFISITSGASGSGAGSVAFTVAANTGSSQRTGTLTIAGQTFTVTQDAAGVPTNLVQLSSPNFNVGEGSGSVQVTVVRTNSAGAATVDYRTSDTAGLNNCNLVNGIASARCDYTIAVGTVRFAAGESAKNISIPIIDDSYADGNENFGVTLSNAAGATLGSPIAATITIQDNEAANGANPVDGTGFFVRQQYLDFLNREPDPGGYAGWQALINGCAPGNATCDRIHVSSGFFRSPEFQDRGYFIYRFYPVSFGRKPEYVEFVPDLAKVSGFLSDAELEAAKVAFIAEFMSRPAFVTKFDGLSNTAYVDTLLSTAGITHIARDFWIAALTNGTRTRAQVLREIAESTEVYNRYYNQAFVVMQYFGYLRRDPDAFYLDWIQVLNTSGDFRGMVNGFMNSLEYRFRFGP